MNNELMINMPSDFQRMNTLPEDPANSIAYGKQTQSSTMFVMMYPISNQAAMPYGNDKVVVEEQKKRIMTILKNFIKFIKTRKFLIFFLNQRKPDWT